ncbi:zinc-binding dehydrogenase [Aquipseudomonas ullengensis]|uniref:Zinc-binding dehydrogenase n=1 Tax=Aquipseudomonas ullengensis TaxID=2759166 RepID=A0A7W4LK90_9GAMM|nr:zinc-binding dehydrogenase [Pseudomonas ullengensis]MBB2494719.1 zinc-binding dehydrogenase [Pseudomonas ullengensis]
MKAVVMRDKQLLTGTVQAPTPAAGEVLVKTLACGICGSDLHMFHHCEHVLANFKRGGIPVDFDAQQDVVFGHEFCAEILDHGPGSDKRLKVGTRVCSMPFIFAPSGFEHVGFSNRYPGGYGEQMVLSEALLIPVPGDLPAPIAALTEPMAVAVHAVNRAQLAGDEVPIVIGCGPIGLALIAVLKARGIGPVVASDYSPKRRALAEKMGADLVVNPAENSPYQSWVEVAAPANYDIKGPAAMFSLGPQPKPCVVFECVGIPGLIQQVLQHAPPRSRLVVVGVCMESDRIEPLIGIAKEMNVSFAYGYNGDEFAQTLLDLADGKLNGEPLITSTVQLDGVTDAFAALSDPQEQAKVMITFT